MSLKVFHGPMCSGKTHHLILRANQLLPTFPPANFMSIKPTLDTRSPMIKSRTGLTLPVSMTTSKLHTLIPQPGWLYVLDEVQFFGKEDLLSFARQAINYSNTTVLAAGLDFDYKREEFGGTMALSRLACDLPWGEVTGLTATCCAPGCSLPAPFTQRLLSGGEAGVVLPGGEEFYRPACRTHHTSTPITGEGWRVSTSAS
jgi:thymidine kinase